jgi:hypothetical protein
MKKLLITLFIILGTAWWLFGQCGFPTVGMGVGVHALDSATIQQAVTKCTPCPTAGIVAWELTSDFNGHFFLNSDNPELVTVQVTQGCSQVLFDTCVSLPPRGVAGWAYVKEFAVIGDCQIYVSGIVGQSIFIDVKGIPAPQEELFEVLYDMDTCGVLLNTEDARENTTEIYRRLDNGLIYTTPLPAGIYVSETFFPAGRKLIQVR